MNPLQQHLTEYLVLDYFQRDSGQKVIEVGLYKVDENDLKFRLIKFVNGVFKEIFTTENKDEALEKFQNMCKR
jgi:hypothetical protein